MQLNLHAPLGSTTRVCVYIFLGLIYSSVLAEGPMIEWKNKMQSSTLLGKWDNRRSLSCWKKDVYHPQRKLGREHQLKTLQSSWFVHWKSALFPMGHCSYIITHDPSLFCSSKATQNIKKRSVSINLKILVVSAFIYIRVHLLKFIFWTDSLELWRTWAWELILPAPLSVHGAWIVELYEEASLSSEAKEVCWHKPRSDSL